MYLVWCADKHWRRMRPRHAASDVAECSEHPQYLTTFFRDYHSRLHVFLPVLACLASGYLVAHTPGPALIHCQINHSSDRRNNLLYLVYHQSARCGPDCPPACHDPWFPSGVGNGGQHHVVHQLPVYNHHKCTRLRFACAEAFGCSDVTDAINSNSLRPRQFHWNHSQFVFTGHLWGSYLVSHGPPWEVLGWFAHPRYTFWSVVHSSRFCPCDSWNEHFGQLNQCRMRSYSAISTIHKYPSWWIHRGRRWALHVPLEFAQK